MNIVPLSLLTHVYDVSAARAVAWIVQGLLTSAHA